MKTNSRILAKLTAINCSYTRISLAIIVALFVLSSNLIAQTYTYNPSIGTYVSCPSTTTGKAFDPNACQQISGTYSYTGSAFRISILSHDTNNHRVVLRISRCNGNPFIWNGKAIVHFTSEGIQVCKNFYSGDNYVDLTVYTTLFTGTNYFLGYVFSQGTAKYYAGEVTITKNTGYAPFVTASPASSVGISEATLNAKINPNGSETHYVFEYGTTTNYGSTTNAQSVGSSSSNVSVSRTISDLEPNTTYHFRCVAMNSIGSGYGVDRSFTTLATTCPSPTANFSASPTSGNSPLSVQFNDISTAGSGQQITSWSWNFGDGTSSTSPNPSKVYQNSGSYSVTLTVSNSCGQTSTKNLSNYITVSQASEVAMPQFTPTEEEHWDPISVTITSPTPGATIRYTTDGSTPTETSSLFSAPFNVISGYTLVKARAFKPGFTPSGVTEQVYLICGSSDNNFKYHQEKNINEISILRDTLQLEFVVESKSEIRHFDNKILNSKNQCQSFPLIILDYKVSPNEGTMPLDKYSWEFTLSDANSLIGHLMEAWVQFCTPDNNECNDCNALFESKMEGKRLFNGDYMFQLSNKDLHMVGTYKTRFKIKYKGLLFFGVNVLKSDCNWNTNQEILVKVNPRWNVPFQTQIYNRAWSTSCMPTSMSMIINYLFSYEFQKINNKWKEKSKIAEPHLVNGLRLYSKGTNSGNNYNGSLDYYLKNYPKTANNYYTDNVTSKYGPIKNESWSGTKALTNAGTGGGFNDIIEEYLLNNYNIYSENVSNSKQALLNALDRGPVIMQHWFNKNGNYYGHYIVLVGKTPDNKFVVHDPWGDKKIGTGQPSNDGSFKIYDDDQYFKLKQSKKRVLVPIDCNSFLPYQSSIFSPYNLLCEGFLSFKYDASGVYKSNYYGDGSFNGDNNTSYNFYNGFKFSDKSGSFHHDENSTFEGWNYNYYQRNGFLYCYTSNNYTNKLVAHWELPVRKDGYYSVNTYFEGHNNCTNEANYIIYINNQNVGSVTIDQKTNKGWKNLMPSIYLKEGQVLKVEISNFVTNNNNVNKILIVDKVNALYLGDYTNLPVSSYPISFLIQPISSFIPNIKMFYNNDGKWIDASIYLQNGTFKTSPIQINDSSQILVTAPGFEPILSKLDLSLIFNPKLIIPMIKSDSIYNNYLINCNLTSDSIVYKSGVAKLKLTGENVVKYQYLNNDGSFIDTNFQEIIAFNLDTGYNEIVYRAIGKNDTIKLKKELYYFPFKQVSEFGDSSLLSTFYESIIIDGSSDILGANIYSYDSFITNISHLPYNILLPIEYNKIFIEKIGYISKDVFIDFSKDTLYIDIDERYFNTIEDSVCVDFSNEKINSFKGFSFNKSEGSDCNLRFMRYKKEYSYLNMESVSESFFCDKKESKSNVNKYSFILDQKDTPCLSESYIALFKGDTIKKFVNITSDSLIYIKEKQLITFETDLSNFELVVMKRLAPIIKNNSNTIYISKAEIDTSLMIVKFPISFFVTDPDSVKDDLFVKSGLYSGVNYAHINMSGDSLIIYLNTDNNIFSIDLNFIHDGINISTNYQFTFVDKLDLGEDKLLCGLTEYTLSTGMPGFVIKWSNDSTSESITVSNSGLYSVVVTNPVTGFTESDSVYLTFEPLPYSPLVLPEYSVCYGSSINILAGGEEIHWYSDQNLEGLIGIGDSLSVNATSNTSLWLTQTVNGCTSSPSRIEILVRDLPSKPTIYGNLNENLCEGDTLILNVQSINSNQYYSWNTGEISTSISVSQSGNFWVKAVNSFGCESISDTVTLYFNPIPSTPSVTVLDGLLLKSSSIQGNQWYSLSGTIEQATDQFYQVTKSGNYWVVVVSENGCSSSNSNVVIVVITGITGTDKDQINIYPNPFYDKLHIDCRSINKPVEFELVSISGKVITNGKLSENNTINTSTLSAGVYFIRIRELNISVKLIKSAL